MPVGFYVCYLRRNGRERLCIKVLELHHQRASVRTALQRTFYFVDDNRQGFDVETLPRVATYQIPSIFRFFRGSVNTKTNISYLIYLLSVRLLWQPNLFKEVWWFIFPSGFFKLLHLSLLLQVCCVLVVSVCSKVLFAEVKFCRF